MKKQSGEIFADMMLSHHMDLLHAGDDVVRDAVIIKTIALLALAFDISPIEGEEMIDVEDCVAKLKQALAVIELRKQMIFGGVTQ